VSIDTRVFIYLLWEVLFTKYALYICVKENEHIFQMSICMYQMMLFHTLLRYKFFSLLTCVVFILANFILHLSGMKMKTSGC
jgi:hypothetical protein